MSMVWQLVDEVGTVKHRSQMDNFIADVKRIVDDYMQVFVPEMKIGIEEVKDTYTADKRQIDWVQIGEIFPM